RVEDEIDLNLYLDPDTSLPMVTTYRTFNQQMGATVTVQLNSSDWRESNGILMPYEVTSYADGELSATTVMNSHSVE
ncbi:MAG: hypothetical protein R6V27_14135, partial [Balneolaceae bacterium]